MHAVHVAADRAFAGSCAANVLTDRLVPKVHRFSLLRVLRMLYTPVVVFFSGINAIALAAIQGQEQYGFSFFIALALDNSQVVIDIHKRTYPKILVRLHTLGVSYKRTEAIVHEVIPRDKVCICYMHAPPDCTGGQPQIATVEI